MTTDRKNFQSHDFRAIIVTAKYPGVVQLVARDIWERESGYRLIIVENPAIHCSATGSKKVFKKIGQKMPQFDPY